MRQTGGSIETYYNTLQSLWREIDFRHPNMMEYESDIKRYNDILQEDRVYIFLDGLDDRLDKARSDVLLMTPFPTVDQTYAYVRREDVRQAVKIAHLQIQSYATAAGAPPPKTIPPSRPKASTDESGCTHCGNPKHTRDTCFKLNGYPDWWEDLRTHKLRETASNSGRAALVSTEPQLALFPQVDPTDSPALPNVSGNCGYAFHTSDLQDTNGWIIDSGVINHMTFDPNDFLHTTTPCHISIANANEVTYPVIEAGTDILTKEIIGCGTKRGGLYYVDDFSMGRANSVKHSSEDKHGQISLWY
ncbi:hypothetical protein L3X38_004989 [Prunus dulcis]|uniref:Retrotransposon gag domain-containing protein n=1 Tax=Prunus dulcis TaxID=3755 RepID=A0AAD5F3T3_PRUDU|nr:hypothetical protein L3X38_004989 [Prunus dulcis]